MTPRAGTMRLACMFSSILLFGAAGLLLFISLQDSAELTPQRVPGEPSHSAPPPARPPRLSWCQICAETPAGKGGVLASWRASASVWEHCVMSDP